MEGQDICTGKSPPGIPVLPPHAPSPPHCSGLALPHSWINCWLECNRISKNERGDLARELMYTRHEQYNQINVSVREVKFEVCEIVFIMYCSDHFFADSYSDV